MPKIMDSIVDIVYILEDWAIILGPFGDPGRCTGPESRRCSQKRGSGSRRCALPPRFVFAEGPSTNGKRLLHFHVHGSSRCHGCDL